MHHAFTKPFTHEEAIRDWLRFGWGISEAELIKDGMTVALEHSRVANDIVQLGAITILKELLSGTISVRLVVSGPVLVMPVARALVQAADVGVVVRYNLAQKTTSLTFYTETGADLSWTENEPWNGGGRPNCKGTTHPALMPIDTLIEWLELSQKGKESD